MMLVRALHAETLKMKRTIALKMVVFAPGVIVLLILFAASQAPFSMLQRRGAGTEWIQLTRICLQFWTFLMMPLFVTLETALVAGLDHSDNQWKSLFARPVPRWTLYVAKLIVVAAMTVAGMAVLLGGILIDGAILPHIQSKLALGFPVPWAGMFRDCVQVTGLAFLALTIQHWVSLRWRSFSTAIGTGIVAMVVGCFAFVVAHPDALQPDGAWLQYLPWALPMLIFEAKPMNIELALTIGCALGVVVAAAGCWDFCRREVK